MPATNLIPTKYTNRPELAAKDPSWTLVESSGPAIWSPEDYKGDSGPTAIINGQPIIVGGEQIQPILTPVSEDTGNMEPSSMVQPQNISFDRNAFAQNVYEELGGDPWKLNISQLATERASTNLRALWDHVFQNQVPWGGRLDEDQQKFWNKEKAGFYNDVYNATLAEVEQKKEAFSHAMEMFEKNKKDYESRENKLTPEQKQKEELETYEEKEKIKQKYATPKPGALTENQVSKNLLDLALGSTESGQTIEEIYAKYYNEYRELIGSGMSREDAYNELLKKYGRTPTSIPANEQKKSYKSLWD